MSKSTMVGGGAIKRPIITLPKRTLAVALPVPAAKPQLTAVSSSRPTMIPSEPPASIPPPRRKGKKLTRAQRKFIQLVDKRNEELNRDVGVGGFWLPPLRSR